jgi:competence protein ComEC
MKLPAVAIAALFAGGILLGRTSFLATHAAQHAFLFAVAFGAAGLLGAAILSLQRNLFWAAAGASLLSWFALGTLASCIAQQPLLPEHILSRLASQQVPLRTPLRWTGTLRSEPAHLPWGQSIEINLRKVETATGEIPLAGGMRVGYTQRGNDPALPPLHAGDEVSIFAEAHQPLVYKDPGAFDRRDFLARQNIFLLTTLRSSKLLQQIDPASFGQRQGFLARAGLWPARANGYLHGRLETIFATHPETAAVLQAILLGDRAFLDRSESVDYQKTGTFHVLAVAGLHVSALAIFLYWLARKLKLPRAVEATLILAVMFCYVIIVEQRAPVLRAGLTAGIILFGSLFYRRLDLLNSAALAALVLLVANPNFVTDSGFLLSFLAIGCIASIAVPLIDLTIDPVLRALRDWRDVTRDTSHAPKLVQFRLDFRDAVFFIASPFRGRLAKFFEDFTANGVRLWLRLAELLLVSFVLQFGMLALMARDFHRVSLLGPLANALAVPLTSVIVPLGFTTLALGSFFAAAARILAQPLIWLVLLQHRIVTFFAAIPHSSYRIPAPPTWLTILFVAGLIALGFALRREQKLPRLQLVSLVLFLAGIAAAVAVYPFPPTVHANELEVDVLDVGQGDSILAISPKGSTLLIDGGGVFLGFQGTEDHSGIDPGEEAVSAYLWSRGFQKLDAVALTHGHQDHIGGLTAVLENFQVSHLWFGRETTAPAFLRLRQIAEQRDIPVEQEKRGQSINWDGVRVDFLWPDDSALTVAPAAKNNDSLVVRLHYGDRTILLPGDAEKQVEYTILSENAPESLHADVLKVGHHGSKNSTIPEFLDAVHPQISIISAGAENPYGHPNPELLERLEQRRIRILRTDQNGAVQVLTDGRDLQVSCFLPCESPPPPLVQAESTDSTIRSQNH